MKIRIAFDRWFWVHVGMVLVAGWIAASCLGGSAQAAERFSAIDESEEVVLPQSIPVGFGGFDHDVLLGQELEALDELEADASSVFAEPQTSREDSSRADASRTEASLH